MNYEITSTKNEKIKMYAKLHQRKYREQQQLFIAEGFHLVEEAKKSNLVVEIFSLSGKEGTKVGEDVIKKLSSTVTPQPIVAICSYPTHSLDKSKRLIILDNVQDPGNVGSIIRSAKGFGFDGVVIKGADPFSSKTMRSSQGAVFSLPTIHVKDVSPYVLGDGFTIGGVLSSDAIKIGDLKETPKNVSIVVGSEGAGISKEIIGMLSKKVYIPINFESLNVSAAAAIMMYEVSK